VTKGGGGREPGRDGMQGGREGAVGDRPVCKNLHLVQVNSQKHELFFSKVKPRVGTPCVEARGGAVARRDKELLIFLSKHLIFISRFLIPNLFADIVYFISPIYTSYYADRFSRKNFDLQNAFFMDPPWYVKKKHDHW